MDVNIDFLKGTQTMQEPDNADETGTIDDMIDSVMFGEPKEIESDMINTIDEADQKGLRVLFEDVLLRREENEAERDLTANGLVLLYDSVTANFESIKKNIPRSRVCGFLGRRKYKRLLKRCETALKEEILGMLEGYGIKVFCDSGTFDGRWHRVAKIKTTRRKELDMQVAKVIKEGFKRQQGKGLVCFRSQIVEVYKYTRTS